MTLTQHLNELRLRIFVALAVTIGTIAGFVRAPEAIRLLTAPIGQPPYFTAPGGALFLQLKLARAPTT